MLTMAIEKKLLQEQLKLAEPALSKDTLVPIWQHYLFTGTNVIAYNARIGISAPLQTDFVGTAPGKMLAALLDGTWTEVNKVNLKLVDGRLRYSAGKGQTATLDSMEVARYVSTFDMPKKPRDAAPVGAEFFKAISSCLQSINEHANKPDELGITLIPGHGDEAKLYSTNKTSMTFASIKLDKSAKLSKRSNIPAEFCQQMLSMKEGAKKTSFIIRDNDVIFVADNNVLFSRLIKQDDNPLDFESVIKNRVDSKQKLIKLEARERDHMKMALKWASLCCEIRGNEQRTRITIADNIAILSSVSQRGEATNEIPIKHPDVKCTARVSLLQDAWDKYDELLITNQCVVMSREDRSSTYLVATYNE
jgi:DNA polymerase III sliding clamp (beta) subunit (PCNA family)